MVDHDIKISSSYARDLLWLLKADALLTVFICNEFRSLKTVTIRHRKLAKDAAVADEISMQDVYLL